MKNRALHLLWLIPWSLLLTPFPCCAQSFIRTTGDNTGISFAEETQGAAPINGNVSGVSFEQWIYGFNVDRPRLFKPTPFYPSRPSLSYDHSFYRDLSRILSTDNQAGRKLREQHEGVLKAE